MTKQLIACMAIVSIAAAAALADSKMREPASRRAMSEDKTEAAKAIAELRSMGPAGLRAFVEANEAEIGSAVRTPGPMRDRVLGALDSICAQKDSYSSRLFWYTDLEQAKSASHATGKPILSLRLLGRLDEDLSC